MNARQTVSQQDDSKSDFSNAVKALSGLKTIEDVVPRQKFEPIEQLLPVSNFRFYDPANNLSADELRMNWHGDVIYPYLNKLDHSIVIANNTGFTYGEDGFISPEKAPMGYSAKGLFVFKSECKIDVNMIAGTHGKGGSRTLKDLSALGAE
jgi:hypothetical protein